MLILLFVSPSGGSCDEPAVPRALFVSVLQDRPVLSSREGIAGLLEYAKQAGISILFVQIYRANQSWFPSKTADQSPYTECFKHVQEDPLALLIDTAHARGIQVHAWLNLLSLSANSRAPILKQFGADILTRNQQKKTRIEDYKIDGQYFLEPGDPRVRGELAEIVTEILLHYPRLDGIQFDYIRYPDERPFYGHTVINIERFKKATGAASVIETGALWQDWKRRQVTELLEQLVAVARQLRPNIQISTTACVPFVRAYKEAFQDWPLWLNSGLVDFVTLMTYPPGFDEFEKYVREARSKVPSLKNVIIAVGAYKHVRSPQTFIRQFRYCESQKCKACAVLHYATLLEGPELGRALRE